MGTGVPSSPRTSRKSFSGVLAGQNSFPVKSVSLYKGEPAVFFSPEDIEVLAKPFKFALVGKFSFRSRPSMVKIRKFLISLGIKSLLSVGLLNDSAILINLGAEEDYTRLLLRALWYIEGSVMKVLKWSPDFNPMEDSPIVLAWVGFPGLLVHFYNRAVLFSIAKAVGNPLKTDESTAILNRPSVARVCVGVDVSKEWPKRLWIGTEKQDFWQEIVVENPPLFCSHCRHLGHEEEGCFKLHPSLLDDLKEKRRKKKDNEDEEERIRIEKEEIKKKKGKDVILLPAANKVYRPKNKFVASGSFEHNVSLVAEGKAGVVGDKDGEIEDKEPPQTSIHPAVRAIVPSSSISLTRFPDSARLRKKEGILVRKEGSFGPLSLESFKESVRISSMGQPPTFGHNECVVSAVSESDNVTIGCPLRKSGNRFEPLDLIQLKGQDSQLVVNQSRSDNVLFLLENEVGSSVVEVTELCQEGKIQPLDNAIKIQPSDIPDTIKDLKLVGESSLQPLDLQQSEGSETSLGVAFKKTAGYQKAPPVQSEKESVSMSGFCQADEIEPLDLSIEIQPSDLPHPFEDNLLMVNKGGCDGISLEENEISSQSLITQFKSQPFTSIKANLFGLQALGLKESHGPASPSLPGCLDGPKLLDELIGPDSSVPINSKGELILSQPAGPTFWEDGPSTELMNFKGSRNLGFEFFKGSSSSGLHILNEKAVSLVGLPSGLEQ